MHLRTGNYSFPFNINTEIEKYFWWKGGCWKGLLLLWLVIWNRNSFSAPFPFHWYTKNLREILTIFRIWKWKNTASCHSQFTFILLTTSFGIFVRHPTDDSNHTTTRELEGRRERMYCLFGCSRRRRRRHTHNRKPKMLLSLFVVGFGLDEQNNNNKKKNPKVYKRNFLGDTKYHPTNNLTPLLAVNWERTTAPHKHNFKLKFCVFLKWESGVVALGGCDRCSKEGKLEMGHNSQT